MSHAADPPSNPPSPGSPDSVAESSPSAASPASQVASRAPRLALLIATGFGLGYLPKAPGTWGSLSALLLFWGTDVIQRRMLADPPRSSGSVADWAFAVYWPHILLVIFVAIVGLWSAQIAARSHETRDPQWIVVDEISGQLITFLLYLWPVPVAILSMLPKSERLFVVNSDMIYLGGEANWQYLLAGFILFRVFDIWKPWPVRAAEKLPGGWGIMADDWVAGIYAALCLWLLRAAGM